MEYKRRYYSYEIGVEFNRSGKIEYFNEVAHTAKEAIGMLVVDHLMRDKRFYQIASFKEDFCLDTE